jgi:hypothetical protein
MVVKVAGMCCVISTGALSVTASSRATSLVSACGPPVDAPISSTRGALRRTASLMVDCDGSPRVRHCTRAAPRRRAGGAAACARA